VFWLLGIWLLAEQWPEDEEEPAGEAAEEACDVLS